MGMTNGDLDLDGDDLKGDIWGEVHRTTAYLGERCRRSCPSGPNTPSERALINKFVGRGVECDPTQFTSAIPGEVPVSKSITGKSSTIGAQRGASQSHLASQDYQASQSQSHLASQGYQVSQSHLAFQGQDRLNSTRQLLQRFEDDLNELRANFGDTDYHLYDNSDISSGESVNNGSQCEPRSVYRDVQQQFSESTTSDCERDIQLVRAGANSSGRIEPVLWNCDEPETNKVKPDESRLYAMNAEANRLLKDIELQIQQTEVVLSRTESSIKRRRQQTLDDQANVSREVNGALTRLVADPTMVGTYVIREQRVSSVVAANQTVHGEYKFPSDLEGGAIDDDWLSSRKLGQMRILQPVSQAPVEPLDLRVRTVAKDFDQTNLESFMLDSDASTCGQQELIDEEKRLGYETTHWNEYGTIHGSQWARYNTTRQTGNQLSSCGKINYEESTCRSLTHALEAVDEFGAAAEGGCESIYLTPSKRSRFDNSRNKEIINRMQSMHDQLKNTSLNIDEQETEMSPTEVEHELHARMMRLNRSESHVGSRTSRTHTEVESDEEDQSHTLLSRKPTRFQNEVRMQSSRINEASSRNRTCPDEPGLVIDGTQRRSDMMSEDQQPRRRNTASNNVSMPSTVKSNEQVKNLVSSGRAADVSQNLSRSELSSYGSEDARLSSPVQPALAMRNAIQTDVQARHDSVGAAHRGTQEHQEEIRFEKSLESERSIQRSPTLPMNSIDHRQFATRGDEAHREYSDVDSLQSDVQLISRSYSNMQLSRLTQPAHRELWCPVVVQGVEKLRSPSPIHRKDGVQKLIGNVSRSTDDHQESPMVRKESRSWSTVDTDIFVRKGNLEVIRPMVIAESQHTRENANDRSTMEFFRTTLAERQRQRSMNARQTQTHPCEITSKNKDGRETFEKCFFEPAYRNISDTRHLTDGGEHVEFQVPVDVNGGQRRTRLVQPPPKESRKYTSYDGEQFGHPDYVQYRERVEPQAVRRNQDCRSFNVESRVLGNTFPDELSRRSALEREQRMWRENEGQSDHRGSREAMSMRRNRQSTSRRTVKDHSSSSDSRSRNKNNTKRIQNRGAEKWFSPGTGRVLTRREDGLGRSISRKFTRGTTRAKYAHSYSSENSNSDDENDCRSYQDNQKQRYKEAGKKSGKERNHDVRRISKCKRRQNKDSDPSSDGNSNDSDGDRWSSRKRKDCPKRTNSPPRRDDSSPDDDYSKSKSKVKSNQPFRWMKLDKYNGKTSWETFVCHFTNCAKYNGWDEHDKVSHLKGALTGDAAQLLWETEEHTFQQLFNKIADRFSGKGIEERYQHDLRCRRRNRNEEIRELAQDIRRLMSMAYPRERSSLSEHIARDAFLTALDNPELELKVREREPTDLESAVKIAQRLEMSKTTVESSSNARHRVNRNTNECVINELSDGNADRKFRGNVNHANQNRGRSSRTNNGEYFTRNHVRSDENERKNRAVNNDDRTWRDETLTEVRNLQEAVISQSKKQSTDYEALLKEIEKLGHLSQLRSTTSLSQSAVQRQPTVASTNSQFAGLCYNCNQPGHISKDCVKPRQNSYQRRNEGQFTLSNVESEQNKPLHTGGTKMKNRRSGNQSTYLKATIGKRTIDCLLDTGSETSILPASLVDPKYLVNTTHTLTAANGTSIPLLGEVTLRMEIGDYVTSIHGLVSEHVPEVMIGIDWMFDNCVVWELGASLIHIGNRSFNLVSKPNRGAVRRVELQRDILMPPKSEIDLPTKVVGRFWNKIPDVAQWRTKPTILQRGVYVSGTLISKDRLRDLPVRAVNVTTEPVLLSAGRKVADLQTVVICEAEQESEKNNRRTRATKEGSFEEEATSELVNKLIEGVHPTLSETKMSELRKLLSEYKDVFSKSEMDLGLTTIIKHHIDTGDAPPFRQPLRRFPPAHVKAISEHVDNMLCQGVIEPACSPYASNIVLVRKKDQTYRCCVDYRQLNSTTRRDAYPLPRIDVCLDAMATSKWFSTLDLRSSYHQVQVNPEDMDKTAFICPRGMYRFRTMPFGLCNAGATFQRLMDIVMCGLNLTVCLTYLDDIIVFSTTIEEHFVRLEVILQRLRESGLKLKPEKCSLLRESVSFLGHIISGNGIGTDPQKTQAVSEWPKPECVKHIRSFLGLASYYRRFVQDFAKIASPLYAITKKNERFRWSQKEQIAFDVLKQALTSAPILAMPTDDDDFVLDTDASDYAIGAVLSQKQGGIERVIAYASRSLDRREQNYCVTRKELLAVVYFLRYFKQYLLGKEFVVRTDHAALTWLKRTPDPIGQQARWLEQMEEYTFVIEHRPGIRHNNADALSRRPCSKKECLCREEQERVGQSSFGEPADRYPIHDDPNYVHCTPDGFEYLGMYTTRIEQRSVSSSQVEKVTDNTSVKKISGVIRSNDSGQPDYSVIEPAQVSHENISVRCGVTVSESTTSAEDQTSSVCMSWTWDDLIAAQRVDPEISPVYEWLESGHERPPWDSVSLKSSGTKILWNMWPRLAIRGGVLKRRFEGAENSDETWQIVLPKVYRKEFMEIAHGGLTGGHLGTFKTASGIQARAYWPTWKSDLTFFMRTCEPCARYHRGVVRHQAPLQTPVVGEPWERVSVDITGPHPRSSTGKQFILTIVDHFSKWAEAIPIRNHTAPTVAKTLMTHVFTRYGAPRQLLTDRGPEFEGLLFTELMRHMDIDKLRTTAYRASTNGVVERFHRTLNSMIGKVISETQRDWDERLPAVMAAYRASPHSSTGFSPNRLFLGRETRMPIDIVWGMSERSREATQSIEGFVEKVRNDMEEAYTLARKQLRVAAERRKACYDIRVKKAEFSAGDWVWYYYPRRYKGRSLKWQKLYTGPYLITRAIPPVNYVLQKSAKSKQIVVHVDKIKKYYGDAPLSWLISESQKSTPCPEDNAITVRSEVVKEVSIPNSGELPRKQNRGEDNGSIKGEPLSMVDSPRPRRKKRQAPFYLKDYKC